MSDSKSSDRFEEKQQKLQEEMDQVNSRLKQVGHRISTERDVLLSDPSEATELRVKKNIAILREQELGLLSQRKELELRTHDISLRDVQSQLGTVSELIKNEEVILDSSNSELAIKSQKRMNKLQMEKLELQIQLTEISIKKVESEIKYEEGRLHLLNPALLEIAKDKLRYLRDKEKDLRDEKDLRAEKRQLLVNQNAVSRLSVGSLHIVGQDMDRFDESDFVVVPSKRTFTEMSKDASGKFHEKFHLYTGEMIRIRLPHEIESIASIYMRRNSKLSTVHMIRHILGLTFPRIKEEYDLSLDNGEPLTDNNIFSDTSFVILHRIGKFNESIDVGDSDIPDKRMDKHYKPRTVAESTDESPHHTESGGLLQTKSDGSRASSFRGFQDEMRNACLLRDCGACVVTGYIGDEVECAHILKPAYAETWLKDENVNTSFWIKPRAYHVRNGIILDATLHRQLDNFKWSFYVDDDDGKVYVYCFDSLLEIHGTVIREPLPNHALRAPLFYVNRFPPKEVLKEHFRQAVLRNVRTNAEPWEYTYYDDEEDYDSERESEWL